ncbi:replication protein, partial [uncultured marine virus]
MSQSKHWCFTINNWNAEDDERLQELATECEYLVYGYETGAQGTPHLQGYVVFRTKVRMGIARGLLGGRAHVEIKRGTPLQASAYCKKEGLFFEAGELPGPQGVRNDMVHARDWIIAYQEEHGDVPAERELIMEVPNLYGRYRSNLLS